MNWIAALETDTAADPFRADVGPKAQNNFAPILGITFLRFTEVRFAAHRAELEKLGASSRSGSRLDQIALQSSNS